jgi:hypothetical protein
MKVARELRERDVAMTSQKSRSCELPTLEKEERRGEGSGCTVVTMDRTPNAACPIPPYAVSQCPPLESCRRPSHARARCGHDRRRRAAAPARCGHDRRRRAAAPVPFLSLQRNLARERLALAAHAPRDDVHAARRTGLVNKAQVRSPISVPPALPLTPVTNRLPRL